MHIGILSGGGDCPGMNAVIRAATLALLHRGIQVSGIEYGFLGLMRDRLRPLAAAEVDAIVDQGGTLLGSNNRADPFHDIAHGGQDRSAAALDTARRHGLDAVLAIGGDGTMAIAQGLHTRGLPMIGVPKTIDNDLPHTEQSFGFDSAVAVATEAIGRLRTTARSHGRVMILETMGRYAGWIALHAGIAGGADLILIPELPFDLELVRRCCQAREERLQGGSTVICIAEGAAAKHEGLTVASTVAGSPDPVRLGGVGERLRMQLEPALASEVRHTLLGHVQRGGVPTAFDRVLATRLGHAAAERAHVREFGCMVTWTAAGCGSVPLVEVAGHTRGVPADHGLLQAARSLGVCLGVA